MITRRKFIMSIPPTLGAFAIAGNMLLEESTAIAKETAPIAGSSSLAFIF